MSKSQKKLKLNEAICKAIRKKAVIQFYYHGIVRTVEPQSHGISSAQNEVIRAVQTNPRDPYGKSIEGKLYDVFQNIRTEGNGREFLKAGTAFQP